MNLMKFLPLFLILLLALVTNSNAELTGLLSFLQYFGLFTNATTQAVELGQSRGQSQYNFHSYALDGARYYCTPDDKYILHILKQRSQTAHRPPIMVKCLQRDNDNITDIPKLLVMQNTKDIVSLLKPIGNATKRHEHGSCVVVHFCTPSSFSCANVAPLVNMLPYRFPTLQIAYIDAYEFPNFNAEFGIVGLPTLMLFHQGRPVVKYQTDQRSYSAFITQHTNIKPETKLIPAVVDYYGYQEPLSSVPEVKTDYYLGLAWIFLLICLANYVRTTMIWKQIVEMVQRNWRESEETQMEKNIIDVCRVTQSRRNTVGKTALHPEEYQGRNRKQPIRLV